ncbi:MAG: asparagine synthase (glutamine-hydrolyzing) [Candidatus Bathyarchaeia archaeon]
MCGIAGFNFEDKPLLRRMCNVLIHRGPDDEGLYVDKGISLGNRRLSIIDIEGGRQPIYNEDESLVVTYNGEIYNFQELRTELEEVGHRFYTNTDTEVIVHSYEEYGERCLNRFNGMFAFALWDASKAKLLLARDKYGIKPLYYTIMDEGRLLFASEVKALLQYRELRRELDLESLHAYINLRYVPRERTLFKGIKKLLPGHYLTLKGGSIKIEKYWDLDTTRVASPLHEDSLAAHLKEILKRAVARHLISDVPLGIYLSGGLDSSIITALARQIKGGEPILTFTLGFNEPGDELDDARYVADYFKTDHKELVIKYNILKDLPDMIWYADSPKRNLYPYYISKEVGKYVKVALGGLGGDELFAGYEWKYSFARDVEVERKRIPRNLRIAMSKNAKKLIARLAKYGSLFELEQIHNLKRFAYLDENLELYMLIMSLDEVLDDDYLKRIYGRKLLKIKPSREQIKAYFAPYFNNNLPLMSQILLADFKVKLTDDFLFVEDAMSMAHSVEARVPFLDDELVDFAFSIPADLKFNDTGGKYILKKAVRDLLPERVLNREKHGFGGNIGIQYPREIHEYASSILPDGYIVKEGLISKDYINEILRQKPSLSLVKHYCIVWDLLAFEIWYRIYMLSDDLRRPNVDIDKLSSL